MLRLRDALCLRLHLGDHGVTTIACSGTQVGIGRFGRRSLAWGGTVALWAGHIEDDRRALAVFLFSDGGEGAEKLVGDVGEDGGATGGNFVLREEEEQAREEIVDLCGRGEVVEVDGEDGCDFCGVGWWRRGNLGVPGAERLVAEADEAAAHAVGETEVAASGVVHGAGLSELRSHCWFPFEVKWGSTPGGFV